MNKLPTRQKRLLKLSLIIFTVILTWGFFSNFDLSRNLSQLWINILQNVQDWGVWGIVIFILIYNIATLCLIPGSVLTMKGGCLYGLVEGSLIVFLSAILGAIASFLLGRYLCRDWAYSLLNKYPQFQKIDEAISQKGWQIVFLTRLCPLFPFNLVNYLFGISQISLKDYVIGSLGMIPATLMYVYFGSLATDLATANLNNTPVTPEAQIITWIMRIIGLIATILITIFFTNFAKQNLNQTLKKD